MHVLCNLLLMILHHILLLLVLDVKRRRQAEAQRRFEESGGTGTGGHHQNSRPPNIITNSQGQSFPNQPTITTGVPRRPNNPYAKNRGGSTTTNRGSNRNTTTTITSRGRRNSNNISNRPVVASSSRRVSRNPSSPPPASTRTNLQRQHPHRGGRIRPDRQFTSVSLGYGLDSCSDEEDATTNISPPRRPHSNFAEIVKQYENITDDIDDDEDDELMNFEVFGSSHKK